MRTVRALLRKYSIIPEPWRQTIKRYPFEHSVSASSIAYGLGYLWFPNASVLLRMIDTPGVFIMLWSVTIITGSVIFLRGLHLASALAASAGLWLMAGAWAAITAVILFVGGPTEAPLVSVQSGLTTTACLVLIWRIHEVERAVRVASTIVEEQGGDAAPQGGEPE